MSREGCTPNPVPLYLISQVVATEVGRHGRAIREIHIVRTGCHFYTVTTLTAQGAAGHD